MKQGYEISLRKGTILLKKPLWALKSLKVPLHSIYLYFNKWTIANWLNCSELFFLQNFKTVSS